MKFDILIRIMLIYGLLLFYGCSEQSASTGQKVIDIYKGKQNMQYVRNIQKILISDISGVPLNLFLDSLKISPDGRKVAYAGYDKLRGVFYVNINNEQHPSYLDILPPITFSPDSKNVAYMASRKKGNKTEMFVVKDGNIISKTYSGKDLSAPGVIFSSDSKNIVYSAREDGEWKVIVDGLGVEYLAFDSVLANTVKFSPNSKTLVYGARKGDQYFITVNGVPQEFYGGIGEIAITDKHLAYAVGDKDILQTIVFDGTKQKKYDFVGRGVAISYYNNGDRLIYIAEEFGKQFVVIDEVEQKKYDGVVLISLSPDGKRLAYAASQGKKSFVVLDGKELKYHTFMDSVTNGYIRKGPILQDSLVFSPDSKHFAYGAGDGIYNFMVLDGVAQKKYRNILENSPLFSPDSQRFGYAAITYRDTIVVAVDGVEHEINAKWAGKLSFSLDSKHFAYVASDENGWHVAVDGKPGQYYDKIILDERKTLFNEDDSFHYIAMRGDNIYLVEEEIVDIEN